MRIQWPLALLALLLVPLAVLAYAAIERRRARYAIHYTNIEVLAAVAAGGRRWRYLLPPVLALLALTCALAALARPEARVSVASEEASIALTVDVSGSMSADDIKPTRLGAAQEAVRRFLAELPASYRVGLIMFSSEPYVAAPLTHDRELVLEGLLLGDTGFGQGTAIGDALARSVEMLQPLATNGDVAPAAVSPAPPPDPDRPLSAILLLSDGAQTRGTLAPLAGAARAKSYGIPVYTVALGTPDGVLNRGGFSRPVPPDPVTLRQIAKTTGGEFFATQSETRLNAVYEDLASRLGHKNEWRELSFALVGLAALFALAAGTLSLVWNQRLP
ncbi:MAG: VWA domain-containing protein [Actinomycetota bacterium]|nr:VWA domain-containing protein [Actinomycetota bacterium]